MDKISKLYYLQKIHDFEEKILLNKKTLLSNKDKISAFRKSVNKVRLDIYRNILLFIASTGMIGTLTYAGICINDEITKCYVDDRNLDKSITDQLLETNQNESEESILSRILRFAIITSIMIFNDLAFESIMYSIGFNRDEYLGFVAAINNIKSDVLKIEELRKENRDVKIETRCLLDQTQKLIMDYQLLFRKLESEHILVRKNK